MRKHIEYFINEYRKLIDQTHEESTALKVDARYTTEYKVELLKQVIERFDAKREGYLTHINSQIEQQRKIIADRQQLVDRGADYDRKFGNALKVLELTMYDMTDQEIINLVEPFKGDYHTMNILRRVLQKSKKEDLIPVDFAMNQLTAALIEIERTTQDAFTAPFEQSGTALTKVSIAMHYYGAALPE
ncbi:hypothetical protein [Paenibacillus sp. GXUN7292]|uniref:hypothetical protein n=1 Tax=Paenibacillus sp. GXUN7292 TaxID=3422499 RepID=UPI003D7E6FC7